MIISNNIDEIYASLVNELFLNGKKVGDTKELTNVEITLTDIENNIVSIRDISPSYLLGELTWYFVGDNSLSFISQFSSFWNRLSDDGETCNSAYGYLMQEGYGFNQIDKVVEILKADPNSRRAKININVPNPNVDTTKDEPCTIALQFLIRDGKLHCTAIMRSNDIWFGFPYDVAFFTELQKYIADELGVEYGEYTHFAVSLHTYDRDRKKLVDVVTKQESKPIKFNRKLFHKYLYTLYWAAKEDGKECLMDCAKTLGVYSLEANE